MSEGIQGFLMRADTVCRVVVSVCCLIVFADLAANGYREIKFSSINDKFSVYNCQDRAWAASANASGVLCSDILRCPRRTIGLYLCSSTFRLADGNFFSLSLFCGRGVILGASVPITVGRHRPWVQRSLVLPIFHRILLDYKHVDCR
eukprot:m.30968 g.30968  ORF g.30968 m.30968 type:complete len:147 (+) comp6871_c0_seq1:328-768(+)